jgi:hypothetical protein
MLTIAPASAQAALICKDAVCITAVAGSTPIGRKQKRAPSRLGAGLESVVQANTTRAESPCQRSATSAAIEAPTGHEGHAERAIQLGENS